MRCPSFLCSYPFLLQRPVRKCLTLRAARARRKTYFRAPLSETLDLTAYDPRPASVELSHDETVETLVVSAAVVLQQPERLLLADEEAADTVGAIMYPSGVATERNVVCQLVDLVAEGEIGTRQASSVDGVASTGCGRT